MGHFLDRTVAVSPLFRLALLKGEESLVLLHLRRGVTTDSRDASGRTPLMIAAAAGRAEICSLLLSEGADPSLTGPEGLTAAEVAAQAGHCAVAEYLTGIPPAAETYFTDTGNDSGGGFDGWEAEEAFVPPEGGSGSDEEVLALQETISGYRMRAPDDEWSSADLALPEKTTSRVSILPDDARWILATAVARGTITDATLRDLWPTASAARLGLLRRTLRDAGVRTTSGQLANTLDCRGTVLPSRTDRDLAVMIVNHVNDELYGNLAVTDRYRQDISNFSAPSREGEARIFTRLLEARAEMLRAVNACQGLSGLLESQSGPGNDVVLVPDDDAPDEPVDEPDALPDEELSDLWRQDGGLSFELCCNARAQLGGDQTDPAVAALDEALAKYSRARDRALEGALKLVPWIARRYRGRGLPLADLVQEGNLGLLRALEKFDPGKGHRFATYASFWIRQGILRAIADQSRIIRFPVHVVEVLRKATHIRNSVRAEHNRDATVEELAGKLEKPQATAKRMMGLPRTGPLSFRLSVVDQTVAPPDRRHDEECLRRIISTSLGVLPARSECVLRMRYGMGGLEEHTLEEIGELFDVTRERIRQIEAKAIRFLSNPGRTRLLRMFL